jgi:hypothetical protein
MIILTHRSAQLTKAVVGWQAPFRSRLPSQNWEPQAGFNTVAKCW